MCLIIYATFWIPFTLEKKLPAPVKCFVYVHVAPNIIMVNEKLGAAKLNFEKEGPFWMAIGVTT